MSIYYNKQHTISFYDNVEMDETSKLVDLIGLVNTWDYFHLVPSSRPYVVVPNPRIQFVTLPRSSRVLDVTNFYTKDVTYEAREGDWEFYIDHDQWPDWTESFDALSDYFDGTERYAILEDQPNYIYHGRVHLKDYKPNADYSTVMLHYDLDATAMELIIDKNEYTLISDQRFSFTNIIEDDTYGQVYQSDAVSTLVTPSSSINAEVSIEMVPATSPHTFDLSLTYLISIDTPRYANHWFPIVIDDSSTKYLISGKAYISDSSVSDRPDITAVTIAAVGQSPIFGGCMATVKYESKDISFNKTVII